MTEEKELEVFFTEIFRDVWWDYGISFKERSIPASAERMINTYKSYIASAVSVLMLDYDPDLEETYENYISVTPSTSDEFREYVKNVLTIKNSENIFQEVLSSFACASRLAVLCCIEGLEEFLEIIISVYTEHFAHEMKNDLYTNGGWEGLKISIADDLYSIEHYEKYEENETKNDLRQVQLNKETTFKSRRSLDKIQQEKCENSNHFPCKNSASPSISAISDENDLSDLSDYEIIGREIFPIIRNSKHRSHEKQVKKILIESSSQQNKEFLCTEINQSDIKENPQCSAQRSKENFSAAKLELLSTSLEQLSFSSELNISNHKPQKFNHTHETVSLSNTNPNIKTHITGSEGARYDRQSEDHENLEVQEGRESTNCLNVSHIAHDMTIKMDTFRCPEIMHESRKSRNKISSFQNERKFADSKNKVEANVDKLLNMKESELQSEVIVHELHSDSAVCEEIVEIYKKTNVSQDYISLLNSFENLNETFNETEPKAKSGKLASKSDKAVGKGLHHELLESKDVKLLKNHSNNSSKKEMQWSAPSGNNQIERINVEHNEESKERFDLSEEKDLKICSEEFKLSKSGKRNKKKKKTK